MITNVLAHWAHSAKKTMIESATGMVLEQLFVRLGRVAGAKGPGSGLWQRLLRLIGLERPGK